MGGSSTGLTERALLVSKEALLLSDSRPSAEATEEIGPCVSLIIQQASPGL